MKKYVKIAIALLLMISGLSISSNIASAKETTVTPRVIEGPATGGGYTYINGYSFSGGDLAWGTAAVAYLLARKFPKAKDKTALATLVAQYPDLRESHFYVYTYRDSSYETFNQVRIYSKNWNLVAVLDERPGY